MKKFIMVLGLVGSLGICAADGGAHAASQPVVPTQQMTQQEEKGKSALLQALQVVRTDLLEPLTEALQNRKPLSAAQSISFWQRWAAEQRAKRLKKAD